jgi:hypothetical protein
MTGAFVVWTVALGEPFASLFGQPNQSLFGSLLLIFYTVVIALFVKNPDPPADAQDSRNEASRNAALAREGLGSRVERLLLGQEEAKNFSPEASTWRAMPDV